MGYVRNIPYRASVTPTTDIFLFPGTDLCMRALESIYDDSDTRKSQAILQPLSTNP